ncbi:MAG: MMPL family transporter [Actinomycetota bacterium]|nr:MMPL family transporter [Actinomycetota bacterium]
MQRWGRFVARRRWVVLGLAALVIAATAMFGTGVFAALTDGGFDDPDSESARAQARITETFGRTDADVLVLYSGTTDVADPAARRAVTDVIEALPGESVAAVATPWAAGGAGLVSDDGRSALVAITLRGNDDAERAEAYEHIEGSLDAAGLDEQVGGTAAVFSDVGEQVEADIARAESITLPVVLLLSLLIFGSLASALLPVLIGGIAILGAFAMLRLLTEFTDVSIFAINVITLLGLGLAIDYALFVVSRFREELARGRSTADAIAATMATAGRTVAFSGLTVAVALASLLLFPQVFLRSMGFGGMAAVLVAMVTALTLLPALLAVLGPRVDWGRVPLLNRRVPGGGGAEHGAWARIARAVMRRPVAVLTVSVLGLLALGLPFLRVEWTGVDHRVLPEGTESRTVAERVDSDFAGQDGSLARLFVSGVDRSDLAAYESALRDVGDVTDVRTIGQSGGDAVVEVAYPFQAQTEPARAVVEQLRAVPAPEGADVLVGGESAALVDLLDSLGATLPWMGLVVVLAMMVLLFVAFGSMVLPVKAVAVNAISVVASFGVVTWIFQEGNLAGTLGFTPLGALDATQPILMLAILFGLSMDYEVFLLSRIREQWDRTHDNTAAVAVGLQRTGGIITSAALLLAVVIGAFSTSGITFIKMIGVGMLVAILVDATVVRALLVPAAMRLMGDANWWAPAPMARWWQRHGFRDESAVDCAAGPGAAGGPASQPDVRDEAERILTR